MIQESLSGIVFGSSELVTAATPADTATQAFLCKGAYEKVVSNGRELVDHLARSHPHPRMRATALAAALSAGGDPATCLLLERLANDPEPLPRALARGVLARRAS